MLVGDIRIKSVAEGEMLSSPDLGLRAVACKGWRWRPGMRPWVPNLGDWDVLEPLGVDCSGIPAGAIPGVHEAATRGYLWAMVRARIPGPVVAGAKSEELGPFWGPTRWWIRSVWERKRYGEGRTEAEALVATLERFKW